jgi:ketosteroid isomerase-like protein
VSEAEELLRLNLEITEQERRGADGAGFFGDVLDDRLCFRRGDGSTIGKDEFLSGLGDPSNVSETLTTTIRQVQVLGDQAFVEAWVYLKGARGGRRIDGEFRNLRFFERTSDGAWRCVMWFNKPVQSRSSPHG